MKLESVSQLIANRFVRVAAAMVLCSFLSIKTTDVTALENKTATAQSAKDCGCDNKDGIEAYMKNVITDAQRRGITCESSSVYMLACINVYCSICNDSTLRGKCIKIASDYYQNSPNFCAGKSVNLFK